MTEQWGKHMEVRVIESKELLETFNSILNSNYNDEVSKEVLYLYFDVIRENVKNKEIKRLEEKLVKEIDPLEQAKLADMIRKLRIGESNNG